MTVLRVVGGKALRGELDIPGSKNAALAILSSVLLAKGRVVLHNVPYISDVRIKLKLLEHFGVRTEWHEGTLVVDSSELRHWEADENSVRPIRTSFYLFGPLIARLGIAVLPAPGGCKIGARPVDFHLKGLSKMGAHVELSGGCYKGTADRLVGTEIYLDFPSAGATQHLMATATLASGITTIQNAALEPEIVALGQFLNRMGAKVEGAGTSTITIQGVEELHGCEFRVPEDRLQAGTYLVAGAITGGDVKVNGIMPEHQTALVNKLGEAGAEVQEGHDWVRVSAPHPLHGIKVKTMPYPGFPTDMQQVMAALLCLAQGSSAVEETIYESRTGHVSELNRMGAKITLQGPSTIIEGVEKLQGAVVEASDLRAGAALVCAGLAAEGETVIKNVHFIDRGYENLEENLRSLGASIERIEEESYEPTN